MPDQNVIGETKRVQEESDARIREFRAELQAAARTLRRNILIGAGAFALLIVAVEIVVRMRE